MAEAMAGLTKPSWSEFKKWFPGGYGEMSEVERAFSVQDGGDGPTC